MAERGLLDDVNTVIASFCERFSGELSPGRGRHSDREILVSLAADPGVLEALSFPREALKQNKDLALAKQLLAQGKRRDTFHYLPGRTHHGQGGGTRDHRSLISGPRSFPGQGYPWSLVKGGEKRSTPVRS